MVADHLAAEPLIVARIRAQVPGLRGVATAADLAGVLESQQVVPAVHVLYQGDVIPTGDGGRGSDGAPQKTTQRWMTVVAVRNAASQRTGAAAREDAGPLISQVITAMAAWKASDALSPFKRAQPPQPGYSGTFAYFPILWTTEFYS